MTLFGYLQTTLANVLGISKAVADLKSDADQRFLQAEINATNRNTDLIKSQTAIAEALLQIEASQKELVSAFQSIQQDQMDDYLVLSKKLDALQATQQQILAALQPPQAVGTQIVLGAEQPQ